MTDLTHPAISEWLTAITEQGKSRHTRQSYRRALAHFIGWWVSAQKQPFDPAAISSQHLQLWKTYQLEQEQLSPATVNLRLVAASRFLKWRLDQGLATTDPSVQVETIRLGEREVKRLDEEQIERLRRQVYAEGDRRTVAVLELLLGTGLRVSELLAMQCSDVQIEEAQAEAVIRNEEGRELRRVPLAQRVRAALSAYLEKRPASKRHDWLWVGQRGPLRDRSSVFRMLRNSAWRAGLDEKEISPQVLRHTFATRYLAANPGDLRGLATILGLRNLETVTAYAPDSQNLAAKIERIDIATAHDVADESMPEKDGDL